MLSIERFNSLFKAQVLVADWRDDLPSPLGPTSAHVTLGPIIGVRSEHHEGLTKLDPGWDRILASFGIVPPKTGVRFPHLSALDCYETSSVDAASNPLTNGCRISIDDSPSGCSEKPG
jgi:hypothetical protein